MNLRRPYRPVSDRRALVEVSAFVLMLAGVLWLVSGGPDASEVFVAAAAVLLPLMWAIERVAERWGRRRKQADREREGKPER
jgi:hypothetical protein